MIVATPFTAHAYDNHGVSPDLVAWEVFTEAVAPSNGPGVGELEFETWATDDDLFRVSPPRWPTGEQPSRAECKRTFDKEAAKAAGFPDDGCIKEEVRRNWAAFRYFVANDLASKAGYARAFRNGLKIDPPAELDSGESGLGEGGRPGCAG